MEPLNVKIVGIRQEAHQIVSLDLASADGSALPFYTPGAHIDLHLPNGLTRQYSLYEPHRVDQPYRIAVLRDPSSRGGSAAVHDLLRDGQRLKIGGPRNQFELIDAEHTLLLAGGIGITPILGMARHLHESGRSFELHYFVRSRANAAFLDLLSHCPWKDRVHAHVDDEPDSAADLNEILRVRAELARTFMCGPTGFLSYFESQLRDRDWPEDRIHLERFAAEPLRTDGNLPFMLRLARSKAELAVPASCTMLSVLIEHGYDVPYSCEQGYCGTCVSEVLAGVPEHRDTFLTDEQKAKNDVVMLCCSRSRSEVLEIDL